MKLKKIGRDPRHRVEKVYAKDKNTRYLYPTVNKLADKAIRRPKQRVLKKPLGEKFPT